MSTNKKRGFTVLLSGEVWENASNGTLATRLPSTVAKLEVDLNKVVRDAASSEEAALLIGREVMKSVRVAARNLRKWNEGKHNGK